MNSFEESYAAVGREIETRVEMRHVVEITKIYPSIPTAAWPCDTQTRAWSDKPYFDVKPPVPNDL